MPEYCPKCGANISSDYKFCSKCGNEIIKKSLTKTKQVEDEKVEIIDDGEIKIEETTNESKDKTKISGTSPMTKGAVYYKKIVIALGILIILLLVSIVFVFLNAQNQYNSLQYSFNSLQSQYDTEKAAYDSLSSNYNSLQTEYNSLQSNYNSLQNNYNSLQTSSNSYKRTVEVRWGQGVDCEQFITPNDPSVISKTSSVLGHSSDGDLSWGDMNTINNWVGANIKYNYDTFDGSHEDCWLYPKETITRGYGDCEDHALLMVSMCKAEGSAPWLWCAEIKLQDGTGHVCVFVKVTGGNLFIFDPTTKPVTFLIWTIEGAWNSGTSKPVYQALQQYENECLGGKTITVSKIFNEQAYYSFNNNQEFSDFWTK